ncbi:Eukaryotic translation initiation factor 3 subunit K [Castilleja foliolosa]|uniref:Eukaryotic translation initiation factor 3 subunit K n=1 Tax=Castilleja foliolosa TaxID=1961234 RepID=A0ABD3C129_9LAMI
MPLLIPERVQMEEQFKTLNSFIALLGTARFRQFWDEVAKSRHILEVVPDMVGFEQAIQAYAIHVLSPTYQKVPRSVLVEAINIKGQSLDKLLEHHIANSGWEIEKDQSKGQLIILPRTEFNHSELKKSNADGIPLDKIARIIPILG